MSGERRFGDSILKAVTWALRILLFLVVVSFAVGNQEPVTVRYFMGQTWQAPLVLVLLAAFVAGAALGLLALVPAVLRQRRRIARLSREAAARPRETPALPPERALLP